MQFLRASFAAACGLTGLVAVGMMFYSLSKAVAAPTAAEKKHWKRRYYHWMMLFAAMASLVWITVSLGS